MARKTTKKKTAPKKSTTEKKNAGKRKPAAKQAAGKKQSEQKAGAGKAKPVVKKTEAKQTTGIKQEAKYKTPVLLLILFPFWGILKIGKRRPTLVIDTTTEAYDKKKKKKVDGFVHREATSQKGKNTEEIFPNPDPKRSEAMYLKRPAKIPYRLIAPNDNNLSMPEELRKRYATKDKKE